MKVLLRVPRHKKALFLLRARKYQPVSKDTRLVFDEPREGFARFDVVTGSVIDAVRLILMLPKGSVYAEVEPLSGWQMDMLTS